MSVAEISYLNIYILVTSFGGHKRKRLFPTQLTRIFVKFGKLQSMDLCIVKVRFFHVGTNDPILEESKAKKDDYLNKPKIWGSKQFVYSGNIQLLLEVLMALFWGS